MPTSFVGELLGTMMLVLLGDGVVGGVLLNKSKSQNSGWIVITTGWAFAVATKSNVYTQMAMGVVILLLVRYTLRKVFLHDLRGIRGTPTPRATLRLTLAPQARRSAASA